MKISYTVKTEKLENGLIVKKKHEVKSLAMAKKLIQGCDKWEVTKFKQGFELLGMTWESYYELMKNKKWKIDRSSKFERFSLSLRKSRIAK